MNPLEEENSKLRKENEALKQKLAEAWGIIEDVSCGTKLDCPICGKLQPCDCGHKL